MLARCYDILFKLFLWYFLVERTIRLLGTLCCDLRFGLDYSNLVKPAGLILATVVLLAIQSKHHKKELTTKFLRLEPHIRPDIKSSFLGALKFSLLGCSCFSLYLLASFSVETTFNDVLKTTACCVEQINQYDLAERIYKLNSYKDYYKTLANWQTTTKMEDQKKSAQRTAAVANVYGKDSIEMADRYYFIAYSLSGHDDNDMFDKNAYVWFERAKNIYEKNNATGGVVDCLSQMVLIKDSQSDRTAGTVLLKEAASYAYKTDKARFLWQYDILEALAKEHGLQKERITFYETERRIKKLKAPHELSEADRRSAIYFALVLVVLAVGLGQITLSEFSLNRINKNLMKAGIRMAGDEQRLRQSISIDLMQNNFESASAKSEHLLRLAEGNYLTQLRLPPNLEWLSKRKKTILNRELFSAATVALMFAAIFV